MENLCKFRNEFAYILYDKNIGNMFIYSKIINQIFIIFISYVIFLLLQKIYSYELFFK